MAHDEDVVAPGSFSVHADFHVGIRQGLDEVDGGELASLVGVEDVGLAEPASLRRPQCRARPPEMRRNGILDPEELALLRRADDAACSQSATQPSHPFQAGTVAATIIAAYRSGVTDADELVKMALASPV